VTWLPRSKPGAGFPPAVPINPGRLGSTGSGCHPVPRRLRSYAALRLPAPIGPDSGAPCRWPTSMRALVLCPWGRRHGRPPTWRASETGHRCSATPGLVAERQGPPRLLGRPLRTCHGRTPRRIRSPPRPLPQGALGPSRSSSPLGIREGDRFRGRLPHGPHVRLSTPRRGPFCPHRTAGYRLGRAHPWPGRMRPYETTHKVSWSHRLLPSPLTSIAWSH
jgi:hypothetical protein